jgi:hypothetical protein
MLDQTVESLNLYAVSDNMMDIELLSFCGKMEVHSTRKSFYVNHVASSKTRNRSSSI